MSLYSAMDMLLPSVFDPASTLPQWTAFTIIGFSIWSYHFIMTSKPDAIRKEEERRRDAVLEMAKAVLAYVDAEDAKPEDERTLPESKRVVRAAALSPLSFLFNRRKRRTRSFLFNRRKRRARKL